ncbi:MAG TPA: alpha/beta hydrolase [Candidatus Saccharimonadales bacterium]|jgi:hypothetical protein
MENAIILHGTCSRKEYYSDEYPSLSNNNWLPWLQKQLLMRDIAAVTPEIPGAFKPDYEVWRREVERFDITPETLIVGHSCGGGFWVRWLSEHPDARVGKIVLVAPWLDPNNIKKTTFFDFEIDPKLAKRTGGVTIFNSIDDHPGIHWSVETLRQTIPGIKYREFENYGHFCIEDMHTQEFPELLAELLA